MTKKNYQPRAYKIQDTKGKIIHLGNMTHPTNRDEMASIIARMNTAHSETPIDKRDREAIVEDLFVGYYQAGGSGVNATHLDGLV